MMLSSSLRTTLALACTALPCVAHAQGPGGPRSPSFETWQPVFAPPGLAPLQQSIDTEVRKTHWLKGGLIGAAIGAVTFALIGAALCSTAEEGDCTGTTIGVGAMGAAAGFVTGALVGGAFAEGEPAPR